MPRMESGRFTRFSENGPFRKPAILHRDLGSNPSSGRPLDPPGKGISLGTFRISPGVYRYPVQNFSFIGADRSDIFFRAKIFGVRFFSTVFSKKTGKKTGRKKTFRKTGPVKKFRVIFWCLCNINQKSDKPETKFSLPLSGAPASLRPRCPGTTRLR